MFYCDVKQFQKIWLLFRKKKKLDYAVLSVSSALKMSFLESKTEQAEFFSLI